MNIVLLIATLERGGAERVTATLARQLSEGHQVTVITISDGSTDFYNLPSGVVRYSLDTPESSAGNKGIRTQLRRIRTLRSLLKRIRPDVALGMMTQAALLAIISSWGMKSRTIISERNYPGSKPIPRTWAILRRIFYRHATLNVVQTREIAEWLQVNLGVRETVIIPNSVSWPIPDSSPRLEPSTFIEPDARVILAVGTKSVQKGFDLLLESFANVQQDDWVLVILGWESENDRGLEPALPLREIADRLGISSKVYFVGAARNITDWYERADLFVLSSRYEGFPNVLLEACAAGLPCIAFNCKTGPSEIINHEENGLLVPAEDTAALTGHMQRLVDDAALRLRLGAAAQSVRTRFSEDVIFAKWEAAIVGPHLPGRKHEQKPVNS